MSAQVRDARVVGRQHRARRAVGDRQATGRTPPPRRRALRLVRGAELRPAEDRVADPAGRANPSPRPTSATADRRHRRARWTTTSSAATHLPAAELGTVEEADTDREATRAQQGRRAGGRHLQRGEPRARRPRGQVRPARRGRGRPTWPPRTSWRWRRSRTTAAPPTTAWSPPTRPLTELTDAIVAAGGPATSGAQIDPVDDQDGGQPGGNIRGRLPLQPRAGLLHRPARRRRHHRRRMSPKTAARPRSPPPRAGSHPANAAWNGQPQAARRRVPLPAAGAVVRRRQPLQLQGRRPGAWTAASSRRPAARRCSGIAAGRAGQRLRRRICWPWTRDADVVVLGDLNDYQFSPAPTTLTQSGRAHRPASAALPARRALHLRLQRQLPGAGPHAGHPGRPALPTTTSCTSTPSTRTRPATTTRRCCASARDGDRHSPGQLRIANSP